MRIRISATVLVAGVLSLAPPVEAQSLLVYQPSCYGDQFGYNCGNSGWYVFSAALDAAFATVDVAGDLSGATGYDALMVSLQTNTNQLTAAQQSDIQAFLATGRRALLFGENGFWDTWNGSILAVVGGTVGSTGLTGTANALLSHSLTAGVSSVDIGNGRSASGGTAVFSGNVITLWGAGQNALTMLDVNVVSDGSQGTLDNGVFTTNTANWLAASSATVPEPVGMLLLGTGLLGVGGAARRRRTGDA